MLNRSFLILIISFLFGSTLYSQLPGSLDNTFDSDGKVTTALDSGVGQAYCVKIQTDGKIIVACQWVFPSNDEDFLVIRYNPDGSLDSSFGVDGIVVTELGHNYDRAFTCEIQTDGKILVGGYVNDATFDFVIVRYNSDGTIDSAFDGDGVTQIDFNGIDDELNDLVIQTDGKIVVAGMTHLVWPPNDIADIAIARLNSDGSLDTSFNSDGKLIIDLGEFDNVQSVAIQTDGKIILGGSTGQVGYRDFLVLRLNTNGSLDLSFDTVGYSITDISTYDDVALSAQIQTDNKIVAGGAANGDFGLIRLNSDGSLDSTFDSDGIQTNDFPSENFCFMNSIVIQPDGMIVAAGNVNNGGPNWHFGLARYTTVGALDSTFDGDGMLTTDFDLSGSTYANSVTLQQDLKIVAAGRAAVMKVALARYFSAVDNGIDNYPNYINLQVFPNPSCDLVNIQLEANNEQAASFQVYNLGGQVVYKKYLSLKGGSNLFQFNCSGWVSGIYLIKLIVDNKIMIGKLNVVTVH